jgi:hypothetical protein
VPNTMRFSESATSRLRWNAVTPSAAPYTRALGFFAPGSSTRMSPCPTEAAQSLPRRSLVKPTMSACGKPLVPESTRNEPPL